MLPHIRIPIFRLFGVIPISPFGLLVLTGFVVGSFFAVRRAREIGLDEMIVSDSILPLGIWGMAVGHIFAVVFYSPGLLLRDPLALLRFWESISSFGGFLGGAIGPYLFYKKRGLSSLEHAEALLFGLVPGWIFGRMGCATVHDHPGKESSFFLAVLCKADPCGITGTWRPGQSRHDLGLYEMFLAIVLTLILRLTRKIRPIRGFHICEMIIIYAPIRFLFDFLRVDDVRTWGLTPGQFMSLALLLAGAVVLVRGLKLRQMGITPHSIPAGLPWSRQLELVQKHRSRKNRSKRVGRSR